MTSLSNSLLTTAALAIALVFSFSSCQKDNSGPLTAKIIEQPELKDAFLPMTFSNQRGSGGLVKSKDCESSKARLSVRPKYNVPESSHQSIVVFIDGQVYDTLNTTSGYSWDSETETINSVSFKVNLPAFAEFNKEKLPIFCEYFSDNRLVHSVEDTIYYIENGEELIYENKNTYLGWTGGCPKINYFENEKLYAVTKKGKYFFDKYLITTITQEQNRYKIETSSPEGYLIHHDNSSYKIPIPAYPTKVNYADLNTNLTPGVYKNYEGNEYSYYEVKEEDLNKYIAYAYDNSLINNIRKIVFDDCKYAELDNECIQIPSGVVIDFVDYPDDVSNVYTSL